MTELPDAGERYLRQLGEGLQAMGPEEATEVLAEVRSHLAETVGAAGTSESGESEVDVLARFGNPDVLAVRILEERGVLSGGSVVHRAALWMRVVAFATDVFLGVLTCMLILLVNDGTGSRVLSFMDESSRFRFFSLWTLLLMGVIVAALWFFQSRRRRPRSTLGMAVVGLRRVRMGPSTRIVSKRDIPGASLRSRSRTALALRTLLALALLGGVCYWFLTVTDPWGPTASEYERGSYAAVDTVSRAVWAITQVYGQVLAGQPLADPEMLLAPSGHDALTRLQERRASGSLQRYSIECIDVSPDDPSLLPLAGQSTWQTVARVMVEEYGPDSPVPNLYECRLTEAWQSAGRNGATSDGFRLESIGRPDGEENGATQTD